MFLACLLCRLLDEKLLASSDNDGVNDTNEQDQDRDQKGGVAEDGDDSDDNAAAYLPAPTTFPIFI